MQIYSRAEIEAMSKKERMEQRWMLMHDYCDGTFAGQRFAKVAQIPVRSLNNVGGVRDGRRFTRRKRMPIELNAMMLVAVANEIARRRAKNKAAQQARRHQRARGK